MTVDYWEFNRVVSPIPATAWYTDGSTKGSLPHWTAVAIQLSTDMLWLDGGSQQSNLLAELQATWMILIHESSPITLVTDSWAVYKGLTL